MLRTINEEDISIAVDFAWKLSRKPETSSYPLYKEKGKLEENFKKSFLKDNSILIGYYKDNELIAVIQFFFINSEKYIQTTGVYISSSYDEVMSKLMNKLKDDYPDYRVLLGFPKENIEANKYFIKNNYKCIDSCLDMRLNTINFKKINSSESILKVSKFNFESYAPFHDKYFKGIYWTSKLIKEEFDKWNIFIYKHEDDIEGSIFIKKCDESTAEIFGLSTSDKYRGKGIEEILLSKSLEELFKSNPLINKTIFFIDDCETESLNMVNKIGFNYFSSYRCYEVWL